MRRTVTTAANPFCRLARFALVELTKDGHESVTFIPSAERGEDRAVMLADMRDFCRTAKARRNRVVIARVVIV
jgi:hypothetical protein